MHILTDNTQHTHRSKLNAQHELPIRHFLNRLLVACGGSLRRPECAGHTPSRRHRLLPEGQHQARPRRLRHALHQRRDADVHDVLENDGGEGSVPARGRRHRTVRDGLHWREVRHGRDRGRPVRDRKRRLAHGARIAGSGAASHSRCAGAGGVDAPVLRRLVLGESRRRWQRLGYIFEQCEGDLDAQRRLGTAECVLPLADLNSVL